MRSSKLLIAVLGAGFLLLSLSNTPVNKDAPASEPSMVLAGSDLVLSPKMLVA